MKDFISQRYVESDYLEHNPDWDIADSPWKADKIKSILRQHNIEFEAVCEVGCGAGGVLGALQKNYKHVSFTGYDIAPDAERFWAALRDSGVSLHVGDFFSLNQKTYKLILLLDVLEHVADPHAFLWKIKNSAKYFVFHFPLDLSASSVLREQPLLHVRRKVGHIHYFTKGLALELLKECGFEVIEASYTGAAFNTPQATLKTRLAQLPRRLAYALNKDFGVRLLGGETLMVLAKPR